MGEEDSTMEDEPRGEHHTLAYGPNVSERYMLLEVDDNLLADILAGHVSLVGDNDVSLTSQDRTFQVHFYPFLSLSLSLPSTPCWALFPRPRRSNIDPLHPTR